MNILFEIGHPAHVFKYYNLINELKKSSHTVIVITKNIESITTLLERFNIEYLNFGEKSDIIARKIISQVKYDAKILKIVNKNNIDIIIGSVSASHVSKLSKAKSIMFDDDDDEVEPLIAKYVHPFCDYLLSPDCLNHKRRKKNTIYYPGYHELAYLHPNRFKPDITILKDLGIKSDEVFFILRFNVFKAHHDVGINGLSLPQKIELVNLLKPFGKIFITTEREIEPELKKYKLSILPEKIHSLMYYATLFVGDSQTMTSEAAVLGVPAIRCNDFVGRISYLEEEESKYGLTFGFKPCDFDKMVLKIKELINQSDTKNRFQERRSNMLKEKIDVTSFMVWFVENFTDSFSLKNVNFKFWDRFKN